MLHETILTLVHISRQVYTASSFDALALATARLGFGYYAVTHHVDARAYGGQSIRMHNYPQDWVDYYDRHQLYAIDPVHRLTHLLNEGFMWSALPERLALSPADRRMMDLAARHGITDGFTIPVHVPGEASASVSFVNPCGRPMSEVTKIMAHWVGEAAFAAARRLWTVRGFGQRLPGVPLTNKQREVAYLVALGKSDKEMAMMMGTSEETPAKHVSNCFARLEVNKRALLVVRALFDGTLTFPQVLPHFYYSFPE